MNGRADFYVDAEGSSLCDLGQRFSSTSQSIEKKAISS